MKAMLSRMRNGAPWLRRGVLMLALTAAVPLAVPATASAGIDTATFTNQATAVSGTNAKTVFKVAFQFRESWYVPVVKAVNRSTAVDSKCDGCGAMAIGLQIVLTSKQDLVGIHALNVASATNDECVGTCSAVALAYQIVIASDSPSLTYRQYMALWRVSRELESLPKSHLTAGQAESQSQQLVNTVMSILQGSPSPSPATMAPMSPAGSGLAPSALVNNDRPIVNLYREFKWRSKH